MTSGVGPAWPLGPRKPSLGASEVHVWCAHLQVPEPQVARLYVTLSTDERERASRYRFPRDQRRFIASRGWLRAILRSYVGIEATAIRFHYNPHGKPELETGDLQFNLAHSEDLALYAIARGRRVGIDIERIRPGIADDKLTDSVFAPREIAALRSLPPHDQQRSFFACWTRKEAYVKARGEGLVMPLDAFEVSLLPGDPAALLSTPAEPQEAARWTLCELDVGPDYAATLAIEGHDGRLRLWQYPIPADPAEGTEWTNEKTARTQT